MQKFIEADYYELDWYYEECSDGNYAPASESRDASGHYLPLREGVGSQGEMLKEGGGGSSPVSSLA